MAVATSGYPNNNNPYNTYRQQQIMTASPAQLLLMTYDFTIQGCKKHDLDQAKRGLIELIESINFEGGQIAGQLYNLYEYVMRLIKANQFDEALKIMEPLRQTWAQALSGQQQSANT